MIGYDIRNKLFRFNSDFISSLRAGYFYYYQRTTSAEMHQFRYNKLLERAELFFDATLKFSSQPMSLVPERYIRCPASVRHANYIEYFCGLIHCIKCGQAQYQRLCRGCELNVIKFPTKITRININLEKCLIISNDQCANSQELEEYLIIKELEEAKDQVKSINQTISNNEVEESETDEEPEKDENEECETNKETKPNEDVKCAVPETECAVSAINSKCATPETKLLGNILYEQCQKMYNKVTYLNNSTAEEIVDHLLQCENIFYIIDVRPQFIEINKINDQKLRIHKITEVIREQIDKLTDIFDRYLFVTNSSLEIKLMHTMHIVYSSITQFNPEMILEHNFELGMLQNLIELQASQLFANRLILTLNDVPFLSDITKYLPEYKYENLNKKFEDNLQVVEYIRDKKSQSLDTSYLYMIDAERYTNELRKVFKFKINVAEKVAFQLSSDSTALLFVPNIFVPN